MNLSYCRFAGHNGTMGEKKRNAHFVNLRTARAEQSKEWVWDR